VYSTDLGVRAKAVHSYDRDTGLTYLIGDIIVWFTDCESTEQNVKR